MIVLGIDTAGHAGSVALIDEAHVLAAFSFRQAPTFSSRLLHTIDTVCRHSGYRIADVAGLAVNQGPGAFTSLRVGLATAQGLAMASGKPLVGCNAFDALISMVTGWEGVICPVIEARRGEVYAAFYRCQDATVTVTMPGTVLSPATLCTLVTERTLFLGTGVHPYRTLFTTTLGAQAICLEMTDTYGMAVHVARLGQQRLCTPDTGGFPLPRPLYIRDADARLPRHLAETARVSGTSTPHGGA